ncbi:putative diguanylate cyclase YcdT [Fundidesulfovibrio magnetotacticus]|uniref:diguanylate cyclase n=1 Tax=Fundidesulfovibrio magnetotacticus TaxID=2730080 RepID=A0A6V8LTN3_9BACT|nr:sensor domain-containing diguanylate cyclase [Fundidesulfovibrio magnetotacticus]GFK93166.1 putative diguanylate cyclase YcdT [Fundidesulfovibrio magnetotacticus]
MLSCKARNKLLTKIVGLLVLVFLPAMGSIVYLNMALHDRGLQDARDKLDRTVRGFEIYQNMLVTEIREILEVVSVLPEVRQADTGRIEETFRRLHRREGYLSNIFLTDPEGRVIASGVPDPAGVNVEERRYFRAARDSGGFSAGEYALGRITGVPVLHFAFPVQDDAGTFAGVAAVALNLNQYREVFRDVALPDGAAVGVYDANGVLLLRSPEASEVYQVGSSMRGDFYALLNRGDRRGCFERTGSDGVEKVYFYARFTLPEEREPYLFVLLELPRDTFAGPVDRAALLIYAVTGFSILLGLAGGYVLYKRVLVDRLHSLGGMMESLAAGDACLLPENFGDDEIGRLGSRFMDMAREVAAKDDLLLASANTDALTGLFNRRKFNADLEHQVKLARRHERPLSLVLFDIDHFKAVNDRLGHVAGDEVLHAVALAARAALRSTDLVYRVGGEEFAVLAPETPGEAGLAVAEKIRLAVEACQVEHGAERVQVTVSAGTACLGDSAADAQELYRQADDALYAAKRAGRNRSVAAHTDGFCGDEPPGREKAA